MDDCPTVAGGYALSLEGYFLEIETMLNVSAIGIGCGHCQTDAPLDVRPGCSYHEVSHDKRFSRVLGMDGDGKLITGSLKDYTRDKVRQQYASLDDFINKWNGAEKKQAIIAELTEQDIILENLKEAIGKEMDLFDMICHTAFDQLPLTRAERSNNVKKRDVFTKYGEQARQILEALFDKYADEGIENIEDIKILKVNPFDKIGTPTEIIRFFGGREEYMLALAQLEQELYKAA